MSEVINVGLENALTHENPRVRLVARAGASKWAQEFQKWIESEIVRGTDPASLLIGVIDIQIMTHSSLAANFVKPAAFRDLAEGYKAMIDERWISHAEQSQQMMMERRR
ncbi:hypothetical protein [Rhizobium sp. 12,4]|uniref:hypothetical protein n=1 Tax=Rhizobium sp. 12,4 TaxID=3405135 RepID=UPI003D352AB1